MRRYNKTYPSKSLKVNVRIVRTALKPGDDEGSNKDSASLAYMQTVSSVLGDGVNDDAALDAWLAQHNGDGDGLFVLGDTSGDGDLSFIIEETAAMMAVELNALDSAGSSERSATAAEQEIQRLKEALEVSELRNKELATENGAWTLKPPMSSQPPAPSLTPLPPPSTPAVMSRPNPNLDRPTPLNFNCTPKDLFARWEQSTPFQLGAQRESVTPSWRRGGGRTTQRTASISEEGDVDRSKTAKVTATRTLARGIGQSEINSKLAQKITLGTLAA